MVDNIHSSLLSRKWKIPILYAAITYFTIQLSMVYNHLFTGHPICSSPNLSDWTWQVNFFGTSSYFVYLIIQIGHLAIKYIPQNEMGSYAISFFVSFLAGISSFVNLRTGWMGNCEDVFGVRFSEVFWAEWLVCVPLLHYVVLSTDIKLRLSQADIIILMLITMVFILGICLHFTHSFAVSVFLLVSSFCCYFIGYMYFYFVTIYKQDASVRIQCESLQGNEYELHLKKAQVQLAVCLLLLLPLFPVVYLMSLFRVINYDITFTLFSFLNVTVKLIFCSVMNSSHRNVTNELTRLRLVADSLALVAETAANESRRLFVRYIMHEVRVPLSSIAMGIGYLEQRPDIDEEAKEALMMMEGATGFMTQTLNDVLDMHRIEEGKVTLDFRPFSIKKTLNHVKLSLQSIIDEKQNNLIISMHQNVPELVIGDSYRVELVILNLVSNALKFSDPQANVLLDVTLASTDTISPPSHNDNDHSAYGSNANCKIAKDNNSSILSLKCTSNILNKLPVSNAINIVRQLSWTAATAPIPPTTATIIFSVIDNGRGISESDKRTLFLPFSQIRPHELQSGGGSGIGLVICKQIVELHGGTISCESELGVGSTFTLRIPFEVVVDGKDRSSSQGGKGEGEGDDEEDILRPASRVAKNDCLTSPPSLCSSYRNNITPTAAATAAQQIVSNHFYFNNSNNSANNNNSNNNSIISMRRNNETIHSSDDLPPIMRMCSGLTTVTTDSERYTFGSSPSTDNIHNYDRKYDSDIVLDYDDANAQPFTHTVPHQVVSIRGCHNNNSAASVNEDKCNRKNFHLSKENSLTDHKKLDTNSVDCQYSPVPAAMSGGKETVAAATAGGKKFPNVSHVLIVDDVSSNRRILAMLLRQRCITSAMAVNGSEGVHIVQEGQHTFDMIFMDNSMPVMNGVEATRRLRAFGYPHLIIGITGNAMEDDVREFLEAGADSVILKPVTVLQINQILVYAKTYGNTHSPNNKMVFTDTDSYSMSL